MRILSLDYGDKRVGVAISDPLGLTAQGIAVVDREKIFPELKRIMAEYEKVDEIVVGLPKTLKGQNSKQTEKVLAFIEALKQKFEIPILSWDERLTTAEAEKALISFGLSRQKRKKVIDKSAAAYILQSYLDSKRK